MSLSISGITGASGTQSAAAAAWQQRQQTFKGMMAAVQSGDMTTAKQDFSTLTGGQTPPAGSPLAALGAALQSGDVAGAQKAAQGIMQARAGGGGHHHHHVASTTETSDSTTSSLIGTAASTATAASPFSQILAAVASRLA